MAQRITGNKTKGITSLASVFLFIFCSTPGLASRQSQQITQADFSKELRSAYFQNDDQLADSLIKDHRLLVKPFVNELITESIIKELKRNAEEAEQAKKIAQKTAATFENIFREKSLTIGVSYLSSWSEGQKRKETVCR